MDVIAAFSIILFVGAFQVLLVMLTNYIWKEKRLFTYGKWLKCEAEEKETKFDLITNDGDPYYNVKCKYRFSIGQQMYDGCRPYFGSKNIGLTTQECEEPKRSVVDGEKTVYYLESMPQINVGYMIYPKKLDSRMYLMIIILIIFNGLFVIQGVFVLSYEPPPVANNRSSY